MTHGPSQGPRNLGFLFLHTGDKGSSRVWEVDSKVICLYKDQDDTRSVIRSATPKLSLVLSLLGTGGPQVRDQPHPCLVFVYLFIFTLH